jgi:hypothetical protein
MARGRELMMLGGSGNVARNVAALGGETPLVGVSAAIPKVVNFCDWSSPGSGRRRLSRHRRRTADHAQDALRRRLSAAAACGLRGQRPVSGEIENR